MPPSLPDALAALRQRFLEQLPDRLGEIRRCYEQLRPSAWRPEDARTLLRQVHSLTGACGTFWLPAMSEASRAIEQRLAAQVDTGTVPDAATWLAIGVELSRLEELTQLPREPARAANPDAPPAVLPQQTTGPAVPLLFVIDDDEEQIDALAGALEAQGFRVRGFTCLGEFRSAIGDPGAEKPAAIVMDLGLPEGPEAGAEQIAALRGEGNLADIPVVIISVRGDRGPGWPRTVPGCLAISSNRSISNCSAAHCQP